MKKRILSLLLTVMMLLTLIPTAALADDTPISGTCGKNLTWKLVDGTLTISGEGWMANYSYETNVLGAWVTTAPWGDSYKSITSVVIESGVTTIGKSAFSNCTSLTSVTIPGSIKTISGSVFSNCSALTDADIRYGVETIDSRAFSNCTALESIVLPESITSFNPVYGAGVDGPFEYCTSLKNINIPSGVTGLRGTFKGCTSLETITPPVGLSYIGASTFESCASLKSIDLSNVTSIDESAFEGCTSLKKVELTNLVSDYGGGGVGSSAFKNCTALESVEAYFQNNKYREDDYYGIISEAAFQGCTALKNVTLDGNLRVIDKDAFQNCTSLETINIPDKVETIGISAFSGCSALKTVSLPVSLTTIGNAAFRYCTAIKDVYYPGDEVQWNAITIDPYNECLTGATFHMNEHIHAYTVVTVVAPTCTEQGYTKRSCACGDSYKDTYTEATGHSYNEKTHKCASCGATDLNYNQGETHTHSYTTTVIEPTCTKQGYTIYSCACGAKVKDNYVDALGHNYNDGACTVCGASDPYYVPEHEHSYTETVTAPTCEEQGYTTYTCSCGDSYVDDYVDANGHYYNSITHICSVCGETDPMYREHEHNYENGICRDCFAIDPDYEHATSGYCGGEGDGTNLTWKLENNVLTISGKGAMQDYENNYFESLIPWYAQRMTIEQLVIEEGVTTIGYDSFSEFYGMTSVVIPDGVTVIGGCAFWCCTNLVDVTIPDSVQTIGQRAFYNCQSLTEISIPVNVSTIEWGAFWNCYNLTDVYYDGTCEQWDAISIDYDNECLTNATIHFKEDTCEHSYTEKVVDPTCTERGYTLHTCSLCGHIYKDTYVAATGHKTETRNVIEATCTQAGYTGDKYCTVCKKVVERGEETPLANHKYILGTCIVCGQSQSGSGLGSLFPSLHTHDFTDEVIAPTCTDMGYTQHVCKDCGFSYKNQYKFSTGHKIELQNAKAATCTTAGYSGDEYCTVCKQVVEKGTEIKALGHTTELQNVKAATCTAPGYSGDKYCTVCKQTVEKGTEVKALGHNYVGGVCSTCGATNSMRNPFKDVDKTTHADYYDAILWAYYNDITKGTNEAGDMFSPELGCTRAQIVTFLWRQSGAPVVEVANPFADVDKVKHADYYNAILWGYSTGVIKGVSDTEFDPDRICTRAEIVTMLYRLDGENAVKTGTQFTDLTQNWYKDAIAWAVAEKITKGTSDTTFTPDAPCTRAQTVTFLYRYFA